MTLRVVLYAEGALELGLAPVDVPGTSIAEAGLGSAHVLVRRLIASQSQVPEAAVSFVVPMRDRFGRVATGSALHRERSVRQLLAWATHAPDLAVVLVDADADGQRRGLLERWTEHARILGATLPAPADPGSAAPGATKHWLRTHLGGEHEPRNRLRIAAECDLDLLMRQRSFELFAKHLARVLQSVTTS